MYSLVFPAGAILFAFATASESLHTPAQSVTSEQFVAEAYILPSGSLGPAGSAGVDPDGNVWQDQRVYLPVTIRGHAATLLLVFGQDFEVSLSSDALTTAGIPLPDASKQDSLMLGTAVEHMKLTADSNYVFGQDSQNGLPPVVGALGQAFLAHYDVVYDGPAHRVRLYRPSAPAHASPAGTRPAWLPSSVPAVSCTAIVNVGNNAGFTIKAAGKPVTAVLETVAAFTKMNSVAARAMGFTEHSPHVRPLPAWIADNVDAAGNAVQWQVTGIPLTFGPHELTARPISIFSTMYDDATSSGVQPTLMINTSNLLGQILVLSKSTGQVCLGVPR